MNKPTAYYIGVTDVFFAQMTTEDTASTAPVYSDPVLLGKNIEIKITPRFAEGKLDASDVRVRDVKRVMGYDVSFNADAIDYALRPMLFARKVDTAGVQIVDGKADPKPGALLFGLNKDNDSRELWCLYKGSFAEQEVTGKTGTDAIEYQTPTIAGSFNRRANDMAVAAVVDTDDEGISDDIKTGWFNKVYETTAATPEG